MPIKSQYLKIHHFLRQDLVKNNRQGSNTKKRLLSNLSLSISIGLTVILFTVPSWAVTCSITQSTPEFVEMDRGGTVFRVFTSDLRQGSDSARSLDLQDKLVNIIQFRQTRADLPVDDPDRMIDPGGPDAGTGTNGLGLGEKLYWCTVDGTPTGGDSDLSTHLCSSGDCLIEDTQFSRDTDIYTLTLRNAQDCFENPNFSSC